MANIVSDIEAIFEDIEPSAVRAIQRPDPLIRATSVAYIRFERPDLERQQRFLEDFGMTIVSADASNLYAAGSGSDPFIYHACKGPKARFVGIGFTVDSDDDLERAAQLPGARAIETESGPGGGRRVTLHDPNGFGVELVHGRAEKPHEPDEHSVPLGYARANRPARPALEPARVRKLGHIVLQCLDFDKTLDWWMRHIGLIVSDAQILADGSVNLAFCRLDLGDEPADHHSVAIVGGVGALYMHSAYEVSDIDAIGQGQQVLNAGGWRHGWGIGRHYYGSQIFDYWRDPHGAFMEHYTDGDRFDVRQPTRYSRFTRGSTWMWGQDQPSDFEGVSFAALLLMLRNLIAGRLRFSRLRLILGSLKAAPRPWLK